MRGISDCLKHPSGTQWSTLEKITLPLTIVGFVILLGFAVYGVIMDHFQKADSGYLFVFIVNCCFGLIYAIKGLRNEDPYDIAILVLSVPPPLTYVTLNYFLGNSTDFKEARLIVGWILGFIIGSLGLYYLKKFHKSKNFLRKNEVEELTQRTGSLRETPTNSFKRPKHLSEESGGAGATKKHSRTKLLFELLLNVNLQLDISGAVLFLTSGYAIKLHSFTINSHGTVAVSILTLAIALFAFFCGRQVVTNYRFSFSIGYGLLSLVLFAAEIYLLYQAAKDIHEDNAERSLCIVAVTVTVLMIFIRIVNCTGFYQYHGKFIKETENSNSERRPISAEFGRERHPYSSF